MTVSTADIKRLYNYSGNRCAHPGCTEVLVEKDDDESIPSVVSNIAHIVAQKLDGSRGNHPMPLDERDRYENLILLCTKHHKIIDDNPEKYTVSVLREWKQNHEKIISDATGQAVERRKNTYGKENYLGTYIAHASSQWPLARLIHDQLDVLGFAPVLIPSNRYTTYIAKQHIGATIHFLLLLTADSVSQLEDQSSELFQQIRYALEVRRNIIIVIFEDIPNLRFLHKLPSEILNLQKAPSIHLIRDYFQESIRKLHQEYLIPRADIQLYPMGQEDLALAEEIAKEVETLSMFQSDTDFNSQEFRSRSNMRFFIGDVAGALEDINKSLELEPDNYDSLIDRGLMRLETGNLTDADHDFQQATSINPNSSRAFNNWALLRIQQENVNEALQLFENSLRLNPSNVDAYLNRSALHYLLKDYESAVSDATEAVKLDDQFIPAYLNRANAYEAMNEIERAIVDFKSILEIDSRNSHAYNGLGLIYRKLRDAEKALIAFNSAIELDPDNPMFLLNRATVRVAREDWNGVLLDTESLTSSDFAEEVFHLRSLAEYKLGNLDLALQHANASLEEYSESPIVLGQKALVLKAQGLLQQAIDEFKKAVAIDENFFHGWNELGDLLGLIGEHSEAVECFERAIAIESDNYMPYFNIGQQLQKMGRFVEAIESYSKAADIQPNDADIFVDRGAILFQHLGDLDSGLADQNRALEIDPLKALAYVNRGIIRLNKRMFDNALSDLLRAIELEPSNFLAHLNIASVYTHMNRHSDAIDSLNDAEKIDSSNPFLYDNRAIVHSKLEDYENAIRDATIAISMNPALVNSYINRGSAYANSGDIISAIHDFTTATQLDPTYSTGYFNLFMCFAQLNRLDEALTAINNAIKYNNTNPEYYLYRSSHYERTGKINRAIVDLKQALRLDLTKMPTNYVTGIKAHLAKLKSQSKKNK